MTSHEQPDRVLEPEGHDAFPHTGQRPEPGDDAYGCVAWFDYDLQPWVPRADRERDEPTR